MMEKLNSHQEWLCRHSPSKSFNFFTIQLHMTIAGNIFNILWVFLSLSSLWRSLTVKKYMKLENESIFYAILISSTSSMHGRRIRAETIEVKESPFSF